MDLNNTILFKIGLVAIVFNVILLVRIVYPCIMENNSSTSQEVPSYSNISGFIIWLLSSVVFSYYLYQAGLHPSFYQVFKIALICLVSPVVLRVYDRISLLEQRNEALILERKIIEKEIVIEEEDSSINSIEFNSHNKTGKFSLLTSEILLFRSANNYVEIHYLCKDQIKKELVRNTLTNIELQIKPYPDFIRCHRTYMVNTHYIEKLNGNCKHHKLTIKGYHKQIPVSPRYYLKVKEAV